MRLLIAEDDSVTRLILSAAVERSGHETTAVADGATAWEALQKGECSVVISDWEMPAMNGAELCRRIRTGPSERYVYFILVATRGGRILSLRHHLQRLEGLLPICSYCKRIEDQGKACLCNVARDLILTLTHPGCARYFPGLAHGVRARGGCSSIG